MLSNWLYNIRQFFYPSTWYGWRLGLQSWWYTREKEHLVFIAILVAMPTLFGVLIYQSLEEKQVKRELRCLALNIYYEARGESRRGQYAVAEVTMNRVASRRFPDTVCKVVYEKRWDRIRKRYVGAFSWTEIQSNSKIDHKALQDAWKIAEAVYYRTEKPMVKGALFYHARYIRPSWARTKLRVASIGQHIFYK